MLLVVLGAASVLVCDSKKTLIFPRRFRLSRRDGFSKILKQRGHFNVWFAVHSLPNRDGFSRLGVSVSKRIAPSAVLRNSIKRMVRECFRTQERGGVARDVVVRIRRPFKGRQEREAAEVALLESLSNVLVIK